MSGSAQLAFSVKEFMRTYQKLAIAALFSAGAVGAVVQTVKAVDCPCPCPKTKTKTIPQSYSGTTSACTGTGGGSISGQGSAPGGGQGGGQVSQSGSSTIVCLLNITIVDEYQTSDGAADACTKVEDDGHHYNHIWINGACVDNGWFSSSWSCKDLTNSGNNDLGTRQITRDCPTS